MSQPASKPTLVLLHGWALGSSIWQGLVTQLGEKFDLLILDLPGYGRTPSQAIEELESAVDWLAATLPAQAHLLGWSLGANLLQLAARRQPARYSSMVSIAANPCFVARDEWPGMAPAQFQSFQNGLAADQAKTLKQFCSLVALGGDQEKAVSRQLRSIVKTQPPPNSTMLAAGLAWLQQMDNRQQSDISIPSLTVLASDDHLVPPAIGSRLHSVSMVDGGHCPMLAAPQQLLQQLRGFYRGLGVVL